MLMFLFYVKQKNKQTTNYKQSKSGLNYMSSWNCWVFSRSKMRDIIVMLCKLITGNYLFSPLMELTIVHFLWELSLQSYLGKHKETMGRLKNSNLLNEVQGKKFSSNKHSSNLENCKCLLSIVIRQLQFSR